jgi:hypothetical protein
MRSPMTQQNITQLGQSFSQAGEPENAGILASHHVPLPATFRFEYCGHRFDAAIRSRKSGGAELLIRGLLGHIPFSAESVESRRQIQSIVDAAKLIEDTDVTVDKSNAVYARRLMSFSSKPPPSYVVAGTAVMAISLKPLCEVMDHRLNGI